MKLIDRKAIEQELKRRLDEIFDAPGEAEAKRVKFVGEMVQVLVNALEAGVIEQLEPLRESVHLYSEVAGKVQKRFVSIEDRLATLEKR